MGGRFPMSLNDTERGQDAPKELEVRGADTGLKPAQTAHPANPAQRKINEIVKTKGKEKSQTCSIPAPGTTYIIDYKSHTSILLDFSKGLSH